MEDIQKYVLAINTRHLIRPIDMIHCNFEVLVCYLIIKYAYVVLLLAYNYVMVTLGLGSEDLIWYI